MISSMIHRNIERMTVHEVMDVFSKSSRHSIRHQGHTACRGKKGTDAWWGCQCKHIMFLVFWDEMVFHWLVKYVPCPSLGFVVTFSCYQNLLLMLFISGSFILFRCQFYKVLFSNNNIQLLMYQSETEMCNFRHISVSFELFLSIYNEIN